MLTTDGLADRMSQLPPVRDSGFELSMDVVRRELSTLCESEVESKLRSLAEEMTKGNEADDVPFKAFYLLTLYHRRNLNYTRYESLIRDFRPIFGHRPLFGHLESMQLMRSGQLVRGLGLARVSVELLGNHAGALHHYAEATAIVVERGIVIDDPELAKAISAAERASALRPGYGKFHATLGRLMAARGRYQEAREYVYSAIDLESSDSADYDRRVAAYYGHLSRIDVTEARASLAEKLEAAHRELMAAEERISIAMEGSRARVIESIAFFSGVIGLILASVSLTATHEAADAALLIVTLTGGLLLAFSGFSAIYRGQIDRVLGAVAVMGVLVAVSGVVGILIR